MHDTHKAIGVAYGDFTVVKLSVKSHSYASTQSLCACRFTWSVILLYADRSASPDLIEKPTYVYVGLIYYSLVHSLSAKINWLYPKNKL